MKKYQFVVQILVLLVVGDVLAINPTPEQIKMFSTLPRAQQEALAKQYGVDLGSITGQKSTRRAMSPVDSAAAASASPETRDVAASKAKMAEQEMKMESMRSDEIEKILDLCYQTSAPVVESDANPSDGTGKSDIESLIGDGSLLESETTESRVGGESISNLVKQLRLERNDRMKYINIESIMNSRLLAREAEQEDPVESCIKKYLGYKRIVIEEMNTLADDIEDSEEIDTDIKPYGYEIFNESESGYIEDTFNTPAPLHYIVGPGDTIEVQLFGSSSESYSLVVNRSGVIQFSNIRPVTVAGLEFSQVEKLIKTEVGNRMIGVEASVSMGQLRSIPVFVMGDVHMPGTYMMSSLDTVFQALYIAGGITEIGSLRTIKLIRKGKTVRQLDLYDFLLRGDTSKNETLKAGDVVLVPTIGKTVGITGKVRRPAIFELSTERNIAEVLKLAGGLAPDAYPKASKIKRINTHGDRVLIDIDISTTKGKKSKIFDGDTIDIPSVLDKVEATVMLAGHVQRPGGFAWFEGMRVSDVIPSILHLKPNPDLKYALIKREVQPTREIKVLRINLRSALVSGSASDNIELLPRDEIIVFGLAEPRTAYLTDLIERLVGQASYNEYPKIATIIGNVRFPDTFPLYEGMTIHGLIESAFDLRPDTDMDYVIIKRRKQNIGKIEIININLRNSASDNIFLKPLDEVYVLNLNEDRSQVMEPIIKALKEQARKGEEQKLVEIRGDVRFPGEYPLLSGMRVVDIIAAAGGLNESAYLLEAEITRTDFTDPRQISVFHQPLSLSAAVKNDPENNIVLFPKDMIQIRKIPNWQDELSIEVVGEVRFPGRFTFKRGETLSSILQRAGGLTNFAHPKAAVFTREELKDQEERQIVDLRRRMQADIAASSLEEGSSIDSSVLRDADFLLSKLEDTEAVGRLVIDLPSILAAPGSSDIVLKPGDNLYIPSFKQSVSVIGEVQFTSSHLHQRKLNLSDYLERAGGLTKKADQDRIYVVKANGSVVMPGEHSSWFSRSKVTIEPGDTIVAPIDSDRVKPLTAWAKVTQIIYQMGLATAAIASL